jgi:L-ascorbate metabolism protein UlaG (beta-lactamase superfamily)
MDKHFLVFDFYQGTVDLNDKRTYVFSSHNHGDHYNREIFSWQKKHPGIQYILSHDICENLGVSMIKSHITCISPYQEKLIDDLKVKAYTSTDEGVAFLVQCEGIKIFHAGDFNWWYWLDDTAEGIKEAEKCFKEEIGKIKGEQIDFAFFPVDPRLKQKNSSGAEYFIREIGPRYLIPMHFWDDYDSIRKFTVKMKASPTRVIELTHRGQEIIL